MNKDQMVIISAKVRPRVNQIKLMGAMLKTNIEMVLQQHREKPSVTGNCKYRRLHGIRR